MTMDIDRNDFTMIFTIFPINYRDCEDILP